MDHTLDKAAIEFSKNSGKLLTVIGLLHRGLQIFVKNVLRSSDKKKQKFIQLVENKDFSKTVHFIIEKWDLFSINSDPQLKKLCQRSIQIRNCISHQNMSAIDFDRDFETLIKLATLIDIKLKDQIENIINEVTEDQNSNDATEINNEEWLELKAKGNEYYKTGNYTEAVIFYSKAIKIDRNQAILYSNRALSEIKLEKFELARQDAEDAIELDTNNIKYYRILSTSLFELNLFEEAVSICENGLAIDPYDETLLLRKRDLISLIHKKRTDEINPRKELRDYNEKDYMKEILKFEQKLINLNPKPNDIEVIDMEQFFNLNKLTQLVGQGHCYLKGLKEKKLNYFKAMELYEEAAKRNNAEAMFNIGLMYGNGTSGVIDYSRELKYFRMAASQKAFYKINDKLLINIGVAEAENGIGNIYRDGSGVDKDLKKAFSHFLKSAEYGCPEGQNNCGVFLYRGTGVQMNYAYAKEWFKKAAEQGIAEAQFNYADILETGDPSNELEAIEYFKKAAEQGSPNALERLQNLTFANAAHNKILSKTIKKAIKKKDLNALFLRGNNFYEGIYGYEKNMQLAYMSFKEAADSGHMQSLVSLSNLLLNDLKKIEEGFTYCLKAAEKEISSAKLLLSNLYASGHGCIRNETEARRWHKRSEIQRSDIELSIEDKKDPKYDIESLIKAGKMVCEFEEANNLSYEGFTISERVKRTIFDSCKNNNKNIKEVFKTLEDLQFHKASPNGISSLKSIDDWFPEVMKRANNGSLTAQNYLKGLKLSIEANNLALENKHELALKTLRESVKYNDCVNIGQGILESLKLIDPNNIDGKYIKARNFNNDFKGCISFLKRCIKVHPNEADFHHLLGCIYMFDNTDNASIAMKEFERALELEYRSDWLYDKAGAARFTKDLKKNKILEAYELFLKSNELDHRKVAESFYSMASVCIKDTEAARAYWKKARDAENNRLPCFKPVGKHFSPKVVCDIIFLCITNTCGECGKEKPKFKCPCLNAFYCDISCQKSNWPFHKKVCKLKNK